MTYGQNQVLGLKPIKILTKNIHLQNKINRYFKKQPINKKQITQYLIQNDYFVFTILKVKDQYIIKNPIQTLFIIKGNKFLKTKNLKQIIKLNNISLVHLNLHKTVIDRIKTAYHQQGFLNINIQKTVKNKLWKEWVYLTIKEGARVSISDIIISGSFSQPSSEYVNFIKNNSSLLIKQGFYNKQDLQKGYTNLINHLRTKGFLQSKIYPDRIIFHNNLVTIKVTLEEGPLTIIKDINLKNFSLPIGEILSYMKLKVQSPLNLKLLEQDLIRIEDFYKNKGFLQAKIINKKNIIEYEQDKLYANLILDIDEGSQNVISQINIQGLNKVKKQLVLQLIKFKIGDILTPDKIRFSKQSLHSTGLFSQINIIYKKEIDTNTNVTLQFIERKSRSLRERIGITSERGITIRSNTELSHRNLFGWGRGLFLNTKGQTSLTNISPFLEYELAARYKEIFVPGRNYEGNINISKSKDIFNYSKQIVNVIHKTQISFFVNKSIPDYINLKWNLFNFENRIEDCINNICPKNRQRIGSSSFTFKWDNRDNIFNPTKGSVFAISGEWASPVLASSQNINFWKFHLQKQFYHSFMSHYTLALIVKSGIIKSDHTIPVSRAFILGGQTSIRAYDGNIEGERIPSAQVAPIKTANEFLTLRLDDTIEEALTNSYALLKSELRFPISATLKGLVFYDIGMVFIKGPRSQHIEYGHSTGIGFRYDTFILPIGLDIAYKLPPKTGANYRFHFSIGLF